MRFGSCWLDITALHRCDKLPVQEWACPTLLSNLCYHLCVQHTVGLAEHRPGCFIAGNPTWSNVLTQLRAFLFPFQKVAHPGCPACLSDACWSSDICGFVIICSGSLWFVGLSNCILESEWIYLRVGCYWLHWWQLFVFIGLRQSLDVWFFFPMLTAMPLKTWLAPVTLTIWYLLYKDCKISTYSADSLTTEHLYRGPSLKREKLLTQINPSWHVVLQPPALVRVMVKHDTAEQIV